MSAQGRRIKGARRRPSRPSQRILQLPSGSTMPPCGFHLDPSIFPKDFLFGVALPLNQAPMVQPDNVLDQQYENQIRPCIDLIDSLRELGVEKDLGLAAIAVIGDQSSGKSSVLESLSGVCLPRGTGMITRCPLELKLKKSPKGSAWCGKISYQLKNIELSNPAQVENEVKRAQKCIAGSGNGVSDQLISLEVVSPNVPDLTLIDLPGLTRVALPNQPPNIGNQIRQMIIKYITKQETINLVVVPSNVDIATTEALELAKQVDPKGKRTLAILTKPDLVDKGSEKEVVSVVKNLAYPLKKGYMIVKCRGQSEIQNNLSLEDAINNEKTFFENHEHFRVLLQDDCATVPTLAKKLTKELVKHIHKTLPTLEEKIKTNLKDAEDKLNLIGTSIPDTKTEKLTFLIEKIRQFSKEIVQATQAEEEVTKGNLKLFREIRNCFNQWELTLSSLVHHFPDEIKKDIDLYQNQYRGREMTGFISFRTFRNIARKQIQMYEDPAIVKLKKITEMVQSSFSNIALKCFLQFPNLCRTAKGKIDNLCRLQQKEAEKQIQTQFKLEKIIYCQDTFYGASLKEARTKATEKSLSVKPAPIYSFKFPNTFLCERKSELDAWKQLIPVAQPSQVQLSIDEMSFHIQAYFKTATSRLANQIPLIIQHYVLFEVADQLQAQMMQLIQDKENLDVLLQENEDIRKQRKNLKDSINRLNAAQQRIAAFPK
ncbi:interferon-induced GTP-binding protein Mx-like [Pyxicephalus adspersus]|uniref:interferon-induced GTP-binding protein Mx-like n=1 Tax=Pyxicephalus adspersus TaxID=30357 RepID=UPI003B5B8C7D